MGPPLEVLLVFVRLGVSCLGANYRSRNSVVKLLDEWP